MGKDVTVVRDSDVYNLEEEETREKFIDGADLIIAMGGDRNFLKA